MTYSFSGRLGRSMGTDIACLITLSGRLVQQPWSHYISFDGKGAKHDAISKVGEVTDRGMGRIADYENVEECSRDLPFLPLG